MINVESVWWKVEIFTAYQILAGELQVRGRIQHALNDPEPYLTLRNIATTPLLPGAPRLQSIAEGIAGKASCGVVRTVEPEPPAPDQALELIRRFVFFQGINFTVKGSLEFPAAADPTLHREMLFKSRFFATVDATISVVGADAPPMQWPHCYVNRDLMVGLYLG